MAEEEIIELLRDNLWTNGYGDIQGIEQVAEIIAARFKTLQSQLRDTLIDLEDTMTSQGWSHFMDTN